MQKEGRYCITLDRQRLKKADVKELANVPGIGRKTAGAHYGRFKRAG